MAVSAALLGPARANAACIPDPPMDNGSVAFESGTNAGSANSGLSSHTLDQDLIVRVTFGF